MSERRPTPTRARRRRKNACPKIYEYLPPVRKKEAYGAFARRMGHIRESITLSESPYQTV